MGPFNAWPTGSGFEHFYGFIGGETNQYAPAIYQDTVPVEPDRTPEEGYHFTEDMTDHAIDWVRQQKALDARQAVLRVLRAGRHACAASRSHRSGPTSTRGSSTRAGTRSGSETLARQKELGVVPADAELTERPDGDPGLGRHAR